MRSSVEGRIGTVDTKYEKGRKKKQTEESHDEVPVPSTSIIEQLFLMNQKKCLMVMDV